MMILPYILIWLQVQAWGALGWISWRSYTIEMMLTRGWQGRLSVITSRAVEQEAWFRLLGNYNIEWMLCDPIMFKFWITHFIHRWIPEFSYFGEETDGLLLDMGY